jgi:hypothetical protein
MFSRDIKGIVKDKMTSKKNKMNILTFMLPPIRFILDCQKIFVNPPWHGGPIRPFGPPEGFFN